MNSELATALRDIVVPPPAPLWPLAPGWWLLVLAVALAGVGLWRTAPERWRRLRRRRAALSGLRAIRARHQVHGCAHQTLAEASVLLKRAALGRFQRGDVAALHGAAWLRFLDSCGDGAERFADAGQALIEGPYRRTTDADVESVLSLCDAWLRGNL